MTDENYYKQLGKKLRSYRKNKHYTLQDLSELVHKTTSTLSKYESGEIAISIKTLFDLCEILNVDIGTLLPENINASNQHSNERFQNYFETVLYVYWYNGENNTINKGFIEINNTLERATFFLDLPDIKKHYTSGYIYNGYINYSDSGIVFAFLNDEPPFDSIHIRIQSLNKKGTPRKGLMTCMTQYYQNAAVKIITSQKPLPENEQLKQSLLISQDNIRDMKQSNFFTV